MHQEWRGLIRELTRQLDGHLVHDRHLAGIAIEVRKLQAALDRRGRWGDVRWKDVTPPIYTRFRDAPAPIRPDHPRRGDR